MFVKGLRLGSELALFAEMVCAGDLGEAVFSSFWPPTIVLHVPLHEITPPR